MSFLQVLMEIFYFFHQIVTAMTILLQMIAENKNKDKITIAYVSVPNKLDYIKKIKNVMHSLPKIELNIVFVRIQDILESKELETKPDAVLLHDLIADRKVCDFLLSFVPNFTGILVFNVQFITLQIFEALYNILPSDTYIISIGADTKDCPTSIYHPISAMGSGRSKVELARFKPSPGPSNTTAISVRTESDIHQVVLNYEELTPQHRLLVLAPYPTPVGLIDQVKRWRKRNNKVSMVMFDQRNVMDKELESMPDMPFSVLHDVSIPIPMSLLLGKFIWVSFLLFGNNL